MSSGPMDDFPAHAESERSASFYVEPWRLEMIKTLERGRPETWGATPLNPYGQGTPDQQIRLMKRFQPLFTEDLPEGISPEFAEYVEEVNFSRVEHRRHKNFDSFSFRGVKDMTSGPGYIVEMAERAMSGNASPAEIHIVGEYYQIPTRELGCITTPYGKRLGEHLPKLRSAVRDNVLIHGGKLLTTPPSYEIKAATYTEALAARNLPPTLLMTRLYDIGTIGDSVIDIERSSFLLRLDKLADYRPELVEQILRIDPMRVPQWQEVVRNLPTFTETVGQLLEADANRIAEPLAVTAFEVNVDLANGLLPSTREHYLQAIRAHRFDAMNPDEATLRQRSIDSGDIIA
ncbi:hypothetical protein LRY29_01115 [Candidatus Saccharibacteria bacterium]|nr:hypothetical protein [Candidatus Saccharibacteria bacterium]